MQIIKFILTAWEMTLNGSLSDLRDLCYCREISIRLQTEHSLIVCGDNLYTWFTYYIQHVKLKPKLKLFSSEVF